MIDAPLLGDEGHGNAGRRIRAAAPVSTAGDTDDRRVIRSFDHTGEIPAVQFTLPPVDPAQVAHVAEVAEALTTTGQFPVLRMGVPAAAPVPPADGVPENTVDLPPLWAPTTPQVPSTPVVPPVDDLFAAAERAQARDASGPGTQQDDQQAPVPAKESAWARRARLRAERRASAPEPIEALADAAQGSASTGPSPAGVQLSGAELSGADLFRGPATSHAAAPVPGLTPEVAELAAAAAERRRRRAERVVPAPTAPDGSPDLTPTGPGVRSAGARRRIIFWSGVLVVGIVLLSLSALHLGPGWLDGLGAVAVLGSYSWAVAARTGGRQVVFSALGIVLGAAAVVVESPVLRSGAAMMTCVVAAVLAVVLTVPARNFLGAVREVVVAMAVASIGAFAVVGFEPVASTSRFEILALCIGMGAMVALVWRFAAGLHGLGTRGLVIVVAGAVFLTASQLYTELLRAYGDSAMVEPGGFSEWLRATLGASPRTTMVLLGVPALVWGVHMRARRRQGWWVCTFGMAATLPVTQRLVNLDVSYIEAGLSTFYSVALGCLLGWVLIRLDLRFTGTRGARARADEETTAVRPEAPRFASL